MESSRALYSASLHLSPNVHFFLKRSSIAADVLIGIKAGDGGRPDAPRTVMGKTTVLLVTDVADERAIYIESLRAEGFSAEAADGPNEAFVLATHHPPDIAVLRIPPRGRSLGGLALLHCLKQHETTSHIPVVVLTTFMQADVRAEALAAGCDGYLLLPVVPDRLVEEVRRLLSRGMTAHNPSPVSLSADTPPLCPPKEVGSESAHFDLGTERSGRRVSRL